MIRLENVSKIYKLSRENSVRAVVDANLEVQQGEFLVITGRSGSGKTTLLNLAAGLTRPSSGRIFLTGTDLWSVPDRMRSVLRSKNIGFIFQFPSLLPALTVLENVALPVIFSNTVSRAGADARAKELLHTVGLADKLSSYPRQLSAGQQQRVVVARALLNSPSLIFADEPTSNLDEQTEIEIMELFKQIHAEMGITFVLVTHTRQLRRYGTRGIEMAGGSIVHNNGRENPEGD